MRSMTSSALRCPLMSIEPGLLRSPRTQTWLSPKGRQTAACLPLAYRNVEAELLTAYIGRPAGYRTLI